MKHIFQYLFLFELFTFTRFKRYAIFVYPSISSFVFVTIVIYFWIMGSL